MLLAEYCFGMYGFAANRRRLRPGSDDVSVSSTPPVGRRVSARIAASETELCNICYQQKPATEHRHCNSCHQMLCTSCCDNIAARSQNDTSFECPYCRQSFVQDIIDLFESENV